MSKRKLQRPTAHRMAMLKNLTRSLFTHGKITTTYFKAKELEFFAGKYISLAKSMSEKNALHIKRQMFSYFGEDLTKKILTEMINQFSSRNGGYTRVIKLGPRRGDAAEMALVELC